MQWYNKKSANRFRKSCSEDMYNDLHVQSSELKRDSDQIWLETQVGNAAEGRVTRLLVEDRREPMQFYFPSQGSQVQSREGTESVFQSIVGIHAADARSRASEATGASHPFRGAPYEHGQES